jgi:hypothetical protein
MSGSSGREVDRSHPDRGVRPRPPPERRADVNAGTPANALAQRCPCAHAQDLRDDLGDRFEFG